MTRLSTELGLRIISGLLLAALALGSAWLGGYAFEIFWLIAGLLVLKEWVAIQDQRGWRSNLVLFFAFLAFVISIILIDRAETLGQAPSLIFFLPIAAAFCFAFMVTTGPVSSRIWLSSGVIYASGTLIPPIVLRLHPSDGAVAILWLFLCVWISDIGAFFVGRAVGGPKLWPRISPKKTWSGFLGGLILGSSTAAFAVFIAQHYLGNVWFSGWPLIGVSIMAVIAAVAGDLFESSVKRRFGVKDSGKILPGHGGVMDRLDSFIFASIFTFAVIWLRGMF